MLVFARMSDDADRFRERAKTCRRLAGEARNPADRAELTQIADELDAEADKIEREFFKRDDALA